MMQVPLHYMYCWVGECLCIMLYTTQVVGLIYGQKYMDAYFYILFVFGRP